MVYQVSVSLHLVPVLEALFLKPICASGLSNLSYLISPEIPPAKMSTLHFRPRVEVSRAWAMPFKTQAGECWIYKAL